MADPRSPEVQQWLPLIERYGDWNPQIMLLALSQESGGNPWANNGNHFGLLQSTNPAALGDPQRAIDIAHQQYVDSLRAYPQGSGYAPWGYNNSYQGQPFGALGITYPNQVSAILNGSGGNTSGGSRSGGGASNVSFTPPAPAQPPYTSDQARYDYLQGLLARGVNIDQNARSFLSQYERSQQSSLPLPPGSQYNSDRDRYDYLSALLARGVNIAPDARAWLNAYNPNVETARMGSGLLDTLPYVDSAGNFLDSPPAAPVDPYGFMPSSGPYGNQTTPNNMAAQNAYQDVLAYQQAAAANPYGGSGFFQNPGGGLEYAGTYNGGVGFNTGFADGNGGFDNSGGGGGLDVFGNSGGVPSGNDVNSGEPGNDTWPFALGGTAMIGLDTIADSGKARMALRPILAVGEEMPPPEPIEPKGPYPDLGGGGVMEPKGPYPDFGSGIAPAPRPESGGGSWPIAAYGGNPPVFGGDLAPASLPESYGPSGIAPAPLPEAPWGGGDYDTSWRYSPVDMPVNTTAGSWSPANIGSAIPTVTGASGAIEPQTYMYGKGGTATAGSDLNIPEEIIGVGAVSGKPYFRAGEAGREKITFTPVARMKKAS